MFGCVGLIGVDLRGGYDFDYGLFDLVFVGLDFGLTILIWVGHDWLFGFVCNCVVFVGVNFWLCVS